MRVALRGKARSWRRPGGKTTVDSPEVLQRSLDVPIPPFAVHFPAKEEETVFGLEPQVRELRPEVGPAAQVEDRLDHRPIGSGTYDLRGRTLSEEEFHQLSIL